MWPPVLLAERPPALRVAFVTVGPILFGVLCGWLLGVSEPIYIVLTTIGIVGAVSSGYEHVGPRAGFARGLASGVLFALAILLTNEVIGADPEAKLPDPRILLAVLFGVVGGAFAALGGMMRARAQT